MAAQDGRRGVAAPGAAAGVAAPEATLGVAPPEGTDGACGSKTDLGGNQPEVSGPAVSEPAASGLIGLKPEISDYCTTSVSSRPYIAILAGARNPEWETDLEANERRLE